MRDYDEYPIIIKDYGAIFAHMFFCVIIVIVLSYMVGHYPKNEFKELADTINFLGILYCIFYMPYLLLLEIPRNFKKKPSFFEFSDNKIYYCQLPHEDGNDKIIHEVTAPIKYIKQVSFCIVTDVSERQGRKDYLSAWKIFFCKSSIAIPLTKLFWFMDYFCTYILLVLPFKIYKLKKTEEPFSLLYKNIVIEFANRNYFLINIYSQKEFDELMIYFKKKKIPIVDKTVFLHHWQIANPTFFDKDERWCDEYEPKAVEKRGFFKRLFNIKK